MIVEPTVVQAVPAGQEQTSGESNTRLFMQEVQLVLELQLKHPLIAEEHG